MLGSSNPAANDTVASGEKVVVLKFPTANHWNPEGVRVTVAVPLAYPAAVAVSCALPLLAKLCIENGGTAELPCDSAKVMDCEKGPVGVFASSTFGELLLSVKFRLLGGAAPRLID